MAETFEGGCACGAVRYRMSRPMFIGCCHCKDCQRQTGSAFVINALIEADRVSVLQGEPKAFRIPTDSGQLHDIYRCPNCGTAVWSTYGGRDFIRFMRVGTLDDPDTMEPEAHIFTRSKQHWVSLPPAVPKFDEYYDLKTLWPADAIARRNVIFEAQQSL